VKKAQCTTQQGDLLKGWLVRCFTKRGATKKGDKLSLDPMRSNFKKFLGDLMLGRFVNPLIPKQTG